MEIDNENYLTELGEVNGVQTVAILNDQSTLHAIVRKDLFNELADSNETSAFTFDNRYSSDIFQGIMPDSGAAGVSTAGNPQFLALQKLDLESSSTLPQQETTRFALAKEPHSLKEQSRSTLQLA
jgi:hypothetical protein